MKDVSIPTRMFAFLTNVFDTLTSEVDNSSTKAAEKQLLKSQRSGPERREFFLYTRVTDCQTQNVVGQLADISSGGFKLDSMLPVDPNMDFHFRISLDPEIADKPLLEFTARSRWCAVDPIDPYHYNVGYQFREIAPVDLEIFNRMMEKYGRERARKYRHRRDAKAW